MLHETLQKQTRLIGGFLLGCGLDRFFMQTALDQRVDANLAYCVLNGIPNDLLVFGPVLIERRRKRDDSNGIHAIPLFRWPEHKPATFQCCFNVLHFVDVNVISEVF